VKAIFYNLLAWAILPFMDTIAKYLSSDLSFFQITWARYFFTVFGFFSGVNHSLKEIIFKTFSSRKFAYIS